MEQFSHTRHFLRQLIAKPHQVVALSPSSPALADRLIAPLVPGAGPVIELGAGTGCVTDRMLVKGFAQQDLFINELNPEFCGLLYSRFPKARIFCGSADEIASYPVEQVQAVVSGLPILSFPYELQKRIIEDSFAKLAPGGCFLQLTHGRVPPLRRRVMDEVGIRAESLGREYRNFPPVKVFKFTRNVN